MTSRMAAPIEVLKQALDAARRQARDLELAINYLLEISADFQPAAPIVGGDDAFHPILTQSDPIEEDQAGENDVTPDTPPPDEYVECDDCGESFHRNGIGPHRRKHRREERIGPVARFDPDQARAAAAAAI